MRWLIVLLLLTGCGSGAVVFAPTPLPPDTSPLVYEHPSGAFSIQVPRQWSLFAQNATTLATASFAPPDSSQSMLTLAAVNLGEAIDSAALGAFIDEYQQTIRPDALHYREINRQAMGDGSWRMTGLTNVPGTPARQVNTFIERAGSLVGVVEVTIPEDAALMARLQASVNTFRLNPDHQLTAADAAVLVSLASSRLSVLNVAAWTTPAGVLYITGEVANNGPAVVVDAPVTAVLRTPEGLPVAEAVDVPLGYGVLPGGLAPFSLRFGQGQPALTDRFEITLGVGAADAVIYGPADLQWIDDSAFDDNGALVVNGTVTNIGERLLRRPRATVTVFDQQQRVIAARFQDLEVTELRPNESAAFQITVDEIGGEPAQYVVNVQALP
jgi:hypothetical protein